MKKMLFSCVVLLFSITMLADELYINTAPADIKIRNKPTTSADMVGVLPVHQTISVVTLNGDWAIVRWNGGIGYVAAKYLTRYVDYKPAPTYSGYKVTKNVDSANVYFTVNAPYVEIEVDDIQLTKSHKVNDSTYEYEPIRLEKGSYKVDFDADSFKLKKQKIEISSSQDAHYNFIMKPRKVYDWDQMILAHYEYSFMDAHRFGLTYGMCKTAGWYISVMGGVGKHPHADMVATKDENLMNNYVGCIFPDDDATGLTPLTQVPDYTGNKSEQYIGVSVGALVRMAKPAFWYAGVGMSYFTENWQTTNNTWVQARKKIGPIVESGFMGNIKGFTLSAGFSCDVLMLEQGFGIKVGLGYTFPMKKLNNKIAAKLAAERIKMEGESL